MRTLLACGLFALCGLAPIAAAADDGVIFPNAYTPSVRGDGVDTLLEDLNELIDRADRADAADPRFLDDLRALSARYGGAYGGGYDGGGWPTRLFYDDFRDGDFTRNPHWIVTAGEFAVDRRGDHRGLRTIVRAEARRATSRFARLGQMGTSDNLMDQLAGSELVPETVAAGRTGIAAIHAPVRIPNSFALRVEMQSRSRGGRLDLGPYQGGAGSGYRLAYYPGQGLALLRVGAGRVMRIATADRRLSLEDGGVHVLDWVRDAAGGMSVAVDGRTVLVTQDLAFRHGFDGVLIVNGGGEYYIRSVAIDG